MKKYTLLVQTRLGLCSSYKNNNHIWNSTYPAFCIDENTVWRVLRRNKQFSFYLTRWTREVSKQVFVYAVACDMIHPFSGKLDDWRKWGKVAAKLSLWSSKSLNYLWLLVVEGDGFALKCMSSSNFLIWLFTLLCYHALLTAPFIPLCPWLTHLGCPSFYLPRQRNPLKHRNNLCSPFGDLSLYSLHLMVFVHTSMFIILAKTVLKSHSESLMRL